MDRRPGYEGFDDGRAMPRDIPWTTQRDTSRVPPRECIRAARDALNQAYGYSNPEIHKMWMFMAEALDWQRRALEQIAASIEERS